MLFKLNTSLIIVFVSLSFGSFAKEPKVALRVVASEHHLLQYRENGENKGPTIEILNAILNTASLKANVSFMPWARAFSTAKNNPNTLILSMIRTPEREAYFHWLIKVSQLARVFVSLESRPENHIENIEQAKTKLIAVVLGSAEYNELISQGFSQGNNLYTVADDKHMVNLLANGRVDLVYADPNNVQDNLIAIGKANVAISYQTISPKNQRNSFIAINKATDKDIVKRLQQAASSFKKTAKYTKLLTK